MSEVSGTKSLSAEEFAKVVHDASVNGTGIDGIVAATNLKRPAVNSRLANLRKLVGKENVPSFNHGSRKKRINKEAVLAALKGEVVSQ